MATATIETVRTTVNGTNPDDIYPVPTGQGEFWDAPDIERIARELIKRKFPDFPECDIVYVWKAKGGVTNGKAKAGYCKKLSGDAQFYAQKAYDHNADYEIGIAFDHVMDGDFTNWQVEALVFHELCHVYEERDEDGNSKLGLIGHDFEGFRCELEEYGFWDQSAKEIAVTVEKQLALWGTPDLTVKPAHVVVNINGVDLNEDPSDPSDLPDFDNPGAGSDGQA